MKTGSGRRPKETQKLVENFLVGRVGNECPPENDFWRYS